MYAIIVLVGGKGSRVAKLLNGGSKPEIKIYKNKKIIDFQISKLIKLNKKIYFLSNKKFTTLKKYLNDRFKNKINYEIIEEQKSLGTAGCLNVLKKTRYKKFLIIDGDLIFNTDLKKFILFHNKKKSDCSLLVHPNNHPYDSDSVSIDNNNKVTKLFNKNKNKNKPNLCLSGIKIVNKNTLSFIKKGIKLDFTKNYLKTLLKNKKKIYAYNTREYVKDVGTPQRIKQVRQDLKSIKYKLGNINYKIPAIFLDKDGVINKQDDNQHYQHPIQIIPGVFKALKKINQAGYMSILVTNQPAVAKGLITLNELKLDLTLLEVKFGLKNVYFDRIYFCPHHPTRGFIGENKIFKIKCNCRKPANGMFLNAINDLNIDIKKSFMIGDSYSDLKAADNTKIKFIKVGNKKFISTKKYIINKNLINAVNYILD